MLIVPDGEARVSATRGALLELKEERRLMQESYDFLDEKRILLATEILKQLQRYQALSTRFEEARAAAADALNRGVRRHGLQGLAVYPALPGDRTAFEVTSRMFLGLSQVDAQITFDDRPAIVAAHPSPEAGVCRERARALLSLAPALAATTRNIAVLCHEYTRTERRARALENILLPEIEGDLVMIEEQLEGIEQEEVLRVRNASRRAAGSGAGPPADAGR